MKHPSIACLTLSIPLLATSGAVAQFEAPSGIYSISVARDNPTTPADERLAGIRDLDFVSGFTLRVFWGDIESSQGVYDFSVIDEALQLAGAIGQRVNLEVLQAMPQYIVDGAAATYVDHRGVTSPVPWDPFAQARFAAMQTALSTHIVNDGTNLPLNQHPTLASVDATSVGLNYGVRDLNNGIRSHPDYTQQRYIDSVVQGVAAARGAFPDHQGFIAFFGFTDGAPGVPVDQQLIALLGDQYNGEGQPTLAFFIENLTDIGPVPFGTGGTGNNLRAWNAEGGDTMMQALAAWHGHPPEQDAQLASLNPATGIELMHATYGTRYFELYTADLDAAAAGALDAHGRPIADDLRYWNTLLTTIPEPASISLIALVCLPLLRRK